MAEVTANTVKELRDKTGAGMMDCKKALDEAGGNIDKAIEILRKQGSAKAEKRAARTVKQGMICSVVKGDIGAMVEVLCETDFVANNEKFRAYVKEVCKKNETLPKTGDVTADVQALEKERLVQLIATTGENMQLRRAVRWQSAGICATYLHMGGRIGVLIDVEGDVQQPAVLNDICMHIAAFRPQYLRPEEIPQDVISKEKEIAASQVQAAGNKPPEILEKIIVGKVNKWYTEVCLTRQPWLRDDKVSVEKATPGVKIKRFLRWEVGEEI